MLINFLKLFAFNFHWNSLSMLLWNLSSSETFPYGEKFYSCCLLFCSFIISFCSHLCYSSEIFECEKSIFFIGVFCLSIPVAFEELPTSFKYQIVSSMPSLSSFISEKIKASRAIIYDFFASSYSLLSFRFFRLFNRISSWMVASIVFFRMKCFSRV